MDRFERVAIITGVSRRQGIGEAIALALAADGWHLLLSGWPAYDAESGLAAADDTRLLSDPRAAGATAERLDLDLSDPASAERLLDAAERLGSVTGLVNNAAHSQMTDLAELDAGTLDRHYHINLRAPALLSRAFASRFDGEHGRIVNLTSGQSHAPMPAELAYAATKGGLEALTTSLAAALAPRRITVNAVDPGATDSGWMSEEQRRSLVTPMGRLGGPQDAARLVRFLLSDDAGWITGQIISSRGGL